MHMQSMVEFKKTSGESKDIVSKALFSCPLEKSTHTIIYFNKILDLLASSEAAGI